MTDRDELRSMFERLDEEFEQLHREAVAGPAHNPDTCWRCIEGEPDPMTKWPQIIELLEGDVESRKQRRRRFWRSAWIALTRQSPAFSPRWNIER